MEAAAGPWPRSVSFLSCRLMLERFLTVAHKRAITCIAADLLQAPTATAVFTGGLDCRIVMWSQSAEVLRVFTGHEKPVRCLLGT